MKSELLDLSRTKHIVGFSGGIDSEAAFKYVANRYGVENTMLVNSQAGRNESPITRAFVSEFSLTVHPVIEVIPLVKDLYKTEDYAEDHKGMSGDTELTWELMVKLKGRSPSRTRQFCTTFLKLIPIQRWQIATFGPGGEFEGWDFERYTGVRRDESAPRANQPFRWFDEFFDCESHSPLADWTKQMCFDYVKASNWPINPLYSLGFNRVGCSPCINSGKDDILRWFQRFPEQLDKVRAYEAATGVTFFAPCVPGMAMNFIDDVIEWAKTDRGGYQFNLIRGQEEPPTCESKYGMCE
jgi:3'-phosphoadenosine 5'-phosphosulfate sulfotransferase (PAPS reductase)/FAD synthetase